ncbi:MAG: hypothetical protein ACE5Q6_16290 [Dehalococcoidia bacterium]
MKGSRGRPPLELELPLILKTVRRHGKALTAAQELGCSDAYIHVRLKTAGLSLQQVLAAPNLVSLLQQVRQVRR